MKRNGTRLHKFQKILFFNFNELVAQVRAAFEVQFTPEAAEELPNHEKTNVHVVCGCSVDADGSVDRSQRCFVA
jgi:hypothetical protein